MPSLRTVLARGARSLRFGFRDRKGVFEHIHKSRYWGDGESVSGVGSSLAQTANIRRDLPVLLSRFGIKSVFDAPCGDLYWMAMILEEMGISYVGGDIVPALLEEARERTNYADASFVEFDIVQSPFPGCDLWLCRDVLFHLPHHAIRSALNNFVRSEMKFLLVTSHIGDDIPNRNVATGDARPLNLLKPPFCFPADKILARFDDFAAPQSPREMLLFARDDLVGRQLL